LAGEPMPQLNISMETNHLIRQVRWIAWFEEGQGFFAEVVPDGSNPRCDDGLVHNDVLGQLVREREVQKDVLAGWKDTSITS
jgi:hypothetical protein